MPAFVRTWVYIHTRVYKHSIPGQKGYAGLDSCHCQLLFIAWWAWKSSETRRWQEEEEGDKPLHRLAGDCCPFPLLLQVMEQPDQKCSVFCSETLLLIVVLLCLRHQRDEGNANGKPDLEEAVGVLATSFLSGFLLGAFLRWLYILRAFPQTEMRWHFTWDDCSSWQGRISLLL